jgi:RNA 3'-terminal phosphate cyclase
MSKPERLVKLDGRTGEGGGQLVRVAVALAALTGTHYVLTMYEAIEKKVVVAVSLSCISFVLRDIAKPSIRSESTTVASILSVGF